MIQPNNKLIALLLPLLAAVAATLSPTPAHAADFDQQFLGKMVPHHQMGIDMANDCVQKATHGELKDLCRQIASKQQDESGKMSSWLDSWYKGQPGAKPSPEMMKKMQRSMEEMKAMTGVKYEVRFMNEMSKHHGEALKDIKPCVSRASHGELKSLCTMMAADQKKEIEQMHGWLCDWHKDCHKGSH